MKVRHKCPQDGNESASDLKQHQLLSELAEERYGAQEAETTVTLQGKEENQK